MPARLSLDFLATETLDPRITFTRSGATATRFNSSGVLETVAANTARFDYRYDGLAWTIAGLLIEEARTNLLLQSKFGGTWTATGAALTPNAAASLGGGTTAATLVEDSSTGGHRIQQTVTFASGANTVSKFYKAGTRSIIRLQVDGTVGGVVSGGYVDANLATGTLGTASASGNITSPSGKITALADGWYQVDLTFTLSAGTNCAVRTFLMTEVGGSTSYTGNGTGSVSLDYAQAEAGAFATSRIPTTTTQLTRNADVALISGTSFSDFFNPSEGTILVEFAHLALPPSGRFPGFGLTSTADSSAIGIFGSSSGNLNALVRNNTTDQASIALGTFTAGATRRVAFAYKANDCAAVLNGGTVGVDVVNTIPATIDRLSLSQLDHPFNGHLRSIRIYPKRLPNSALQTLTTSGVTIADLDPAGITPSPLDLSLTYTPLVVVPVDTPASRRGVVPAESRRGIA